MKIALAQMNSLNGNILFNEKKILECILKAQKQKARLLIFPEMALNGYSPLDLLNKKSFLRQISRSIQKIHKQTPRDMTVLLGAAGPDFSPKISVFLLQKNKKVKCFSKEILADYDVFDERRYFKTGKIQDNSFTLKNIMIQILMCEETWHKPLLKYEKNPDLIISLNASPFSLHKDKKRKQVAGRWAKKYQCPVIYLNSVGGQEELIFDGGSFILDQKENLIHQNSFFEENLFCFDFPVKKKKNTPPPSKKKRHTLQEQTTKALTFGLKEFIKKNGFKNIHLGLSGGVDSALVAALACKAFGPKKVQLFFLPGPFTSRLSEQCAIEIADQLQCRLLTQDIENLYIKTLGMKTLGAKKDFLDITKQNIQARLRSLFLMAYANNHPESLLLGTSNKSELALGYGTLYGDITGGLLPIGDLFKTEVYQLSRYLKIPARILKRKASAELKKDQKDEDDLPSYKTLDPVLKKLIEEEKDPGSSFEKRIFKWIIDSEFKRRQSPPVLKIKERSFDRGWRVPLSMKSYLPNSR